MTKLPNNKDLAKTMLTMNAGERALAIDSLPTATDRTMVTTFLCRFEKEASDSATRQQKGARLMMASV